MEGEEGGEGDRVRQGRLRLTGGNSGYRLVLVAVGFAQSEQNVDVRPVGEHLLDGSDLAAVFFLHFADLALVLQGGQGRLCVMFAVAIRGRIPRTGAATSPR